MKRYLLGTDIGTSGTKTILVDLSGHVLSQDLQEYNVLTPEPLWAEQWPDVWLDAVKRSIRRTVEKAAVSKEEIAGLCISGLYGGAGVPLDQEMNPVRPCIIWMDRRAEQQEAWVKANLDVEKLTRITQNGTDPYYGYLKILWIRQNEPDHWDKIKLFLPPNAYIIYKLTGEAAIDYSSAGNLGGIFDLTKRSWSKEMMDALGIPLTMMPPRIVENTEAVGKLSEEASAQLGLASGIPVFNGGVDCGAAAFGMGVFEPGTFAATVGTSMCAAFVHEGEIQNRELISWPYVYQAKKLTYSFGGAATAGAVVKWFRDTFAQKEKESGQDAYMLLDQQAEKIPVGSDGLVVLPYFMGERSPLWDTNAKGVIFGLSLVHTKAHIYRAVLESVAYSLRHTIECCNVDPNAMIMLSGGVSKSPLWKQIFADVTGHRIVCPVQTVEANLGDAMLAGLGTGLVTESDLRNWDVLGEPIAPNEEHHHVYDRYYKIYRDLYCHLKDDMAEISKI